MTTTSVRKDLTKSDGAYLALRRAIVTGDIAPNDPLDETHLTTTYGFGRTPCREALKRLALEHFISWPPRRSPYVRAIDATELVRLHEARLALEVRTAELAAERITDGALDFLDSQVAQMGEYVRDRRVFDVVLCDHAVHHGIARASDNRFLAESVAALNLGTLRLWHQAMSRQDMSTVPDDHGRIVDALRRHDSAAAAAEMTDHIQQNYDRQLWLLQQPVGEQPAPARAARSPHRKETRHAQHSQRG